MVTYGLITLLLLSPFLVFLQSTVGIIQQVGNISPQVGGATTVRVNWMPFEFDRDDPIHHARASLRATRQCEMGWRSLQTMRAEASSRSTSC